MLLYEIDSLFGKAQRPERSQLGARGSEELTSVLNHLHTKTWRGVTLEDFVSLVGVAGTVSVLSVKGFMYFLPGLLRLALMAKDEDEHYAVVDAMLTVLAHPDYITPTQEHVSILTTLSPEQRGFLIRFFEEIGGKLPALCPIVLDAGVASLKAGEMIPYTQKALNEWVIKNA